MKEKKLMNKSKATKFTSESSDLSLISSDSSMFGDSNLSKIHRSTDKPKDDDFIDEEFENLFKNYKMEVDHQDKYMNSYKRSFSESGNYRNYVIKENPSSDEESPVKMSIRKGAYSSLKKIPQETKAVNKSLQCQNDNDFDLINIVKNLADLEKKWIKDQKIGGKRKFRRSKPKSKFTKRTSKFNIHYNTQCLDSDIRDSE